MAEHSFVDCARKRLQDKPDCRSSGAAALRIKLTATHLVPFNRRPHPVVRPEGIAQHRQLLLDRAMPAPRNPPDHLDPTGHTTTRMTSPFLAVQIPHQHTPDQRVANSAAMPARARRPTDRAYSVSDFDAKHRKAGKSGIRCRRILMGRRANFGSSSQRRRLPR